jgi:hypothetical protein
MLGAQHNEVYSHLYKKVKCKNFCQEFMPVVLATQEAEIRNIMVRRQPRQIVCKTLSQKIPSQKMAGGVAQGTGCEFKYLKKKKKEFLTCYLVGSFLPFTVFKE